MSTGNITYVLVNIVGTLLRFLPFSCKTGLIKIGNPDRNSPVFLTCNYRLTVERVKKSLKDMDCYLLVATSRGINVWCSATGGHFTNHDVISVLKTSGIEESVDHRTVVLPQLAAPGVEERVVKKKTGWKVVWGPVYAKDIPEFTKNNYKKTEKMREVSFPLRERCEMAFAWAFLGSVILGFLMVLFWREAVLPFIFLVWGVSLVMYVSFPLYEKRLSGKILFLDFERGGFQVILWGLLMVGLTGYSVLAGILWEVILRWGIVTLIVILILTFDIAGCTPVYGSGLHGEKMFVVSLDKKKCKGVGVCEQVCPRSCFTVDGHTATVETDQCIRCGGCIVQCPFDALCFESPEGDIIPPETIRKYKLNLMGSRLVKVQK